MRLFPIILLLAVTAPAYQYQCSGSLNGKHYCYYDVGSFGTNIIISSSHGGSLKPTSIPDRDYGCLYSGSTCSWWHSCGTKSSKCMAKTSKDLYTKEIAVSLAEELKKLTGRRPHLIVNELHRIKLDTNREYSEGTFYNTEAGTAYNQFHSFIAQAKQSITGYGLFVDIHGQTHSESWVELGYLVTSSRLNADNPVASYSTIKTLAYRSSASFKSVLRGSWSLGYFLQKGGYKTIPSPDHLRPGSGNYFSGGFNAKRYGSKYGGWVDGIQIEAPSKYRNSKSAPTFGKDLAEAIYEFMKKNNY